MSDVITDARGVRAVLTGDGYRVPPVDPHARTGIGWLRATVARFCDGPEHERRRGYAVDLLAGIDPVDLRRQAYERTLAGAGDAREVVVGVLARALGVRDRDLTPAVATVARAYQPHTGGGREADEAVATLIDAFGGVADEATAARIGLLVQACDATAALIDAASRHGDVARALRLEPPVRRTRRVRDGAEIQVDLAADPALAFGAGVHRCPGSAHATAIADGAVSAVSGVSGVRARRHPSHFGTGT
jgi:cytochrome P450